MRTNHFFCRPSVFLAACLFVSCVDSKYDLADVDMTVGTTADVTLPSSSTGSILLKNILDLGEGGVIQVVNGEYYLSESGTADVPSVAITPISIPCPKLDPVKTEISVDDIGGASRSSYSSGGDFDIPELKDIPNISINYTIKESDNINYKINVESNPVPSEIVSLDSVKLKSGTTLNAQIKIYFDDMHSFVNKVHLDNLKLTFPKGLHVEHAEFRHFTDANSDKPVDEPAVEIDNENGVILLTKTDKSTIVDKDHVINILITFDKAILTNNPDPGYKEGFVFDTAERKVSLDGLLNIDGTFRLETSDFDLSKLTAQQVMDVVNKGSFSAIRPEFVKFEGSASFNSDIYVDSFGGKIKTSVGKISPIKLDNLPDFLLDPEVKLDLANPALFIKVFNPFPSDVKTSMVITGYKDDVMSEPIVTGEMLFPANKEVVFCLAVAPEKAVAPKAMQAYARVNKQITNLNDLLLDLPDEIRVEIADVEMTIEDMNIAEAKNYPIEVAYEIFTPLAFGNQFKMVYTGEEKGLSADLADLDGIDIKSVRINADLESNLPLDLKLSLDIQDAEGNSLKGTHGLSVSDIEVRGHNGDGAFSTTPVLLEITHNSNDKIGDVLKKIDQLKFRAELSSNGNSEALSESSYIKLNNIRITLHGTVAFDAN